MYKKYWKIYTLQRWIKNCHFHQREMKKRKSSIKVNRAQHLLEQWQKFMFSLSLPPFTFSSITIFRKSGGISLSLYTVLVLMQKMTLCELSVLKVVLILDDGDDDFFQHTLEDVKVFQTFISLSLTWKDSNFSSIHCCFFLLFSVNKLEENFQSLLLKLSLSPGKIGYIFRNNLFFI